MSRVAVVTGAASGIGAAVGAELAARGWQVAGVDLRESATALPLTADVRDADQVSAAVERARRELGPVDAVVSVAGHYEMVPLAAITQEQWQRMLRVHLGGLFNLSRAVVPDMVDRGTGCIVAITSELAIGGGDSDSHYASAKGAIIGFVRSLAAELAASGVRVNAVAPGPTDTPLLAADSPWRAPDYLATLPLRRLTRPSEIARTVAWVVEEGTFCVGEVISPNSGAVI